MKTLLRLLELVDACGPACDWVEEGEYEDLEDAWAACENAKWKLWLIGRVLPHELTGARMADLFERIQKELKVPGDYTSQYRALRYGRSKQKSASKMNLTCSFAQALYNALLVNSAEWYSSVFDNSLGTVIECDHPLLVEFVDRYVQSVSVALEEHGELAEPSAPISGGDQLKHRPQLRRHHRSSRVSRGHRRKWRSRIHSRT